MKALQLENPEKFRMIDLPEPEGPACDEALVQVHRVGVCGTDISGYLGKMPFFKYPVIPGHELGVEVLAVGSEVNNVSVGARCSVEPYINNPNSFASQLGKTNCCEELEVLGVHCDGGLRERFLVPGRKLHASKALPYEQLALVETLAIGCHAVDRAQATQKETALVIGAGPIGLTVVEFLKVCGTKTIVLDVNEQRLRFCRESMGVDHAILVEGGDTDIQALREVGGGALPTLVVDATGNHQSMSRALEFSAHTGRVVYVGLTTQNVTFPHPLMHRKELTLLSSRNGLPKDFKKIIGLIEAGTIDTKPWITHRTQLRDVIDVFPSYTKPDNGVIKAVIEVTAP
jgi:2-desacetyl-2-hydroxyethyl bacteriochlorophyllide A dehydrogenase